MECCASVYILAMAKKLLLGTVNTVFITANWERTSGFVTATKKSSNSSHLSCRPTQVQNLGMAHTGSLQSTQELGGSSQLSHKQREEVHCM